VWTLCVVCHLPGRHSRGRQRQEPIATAEMEVVDGSGEDE
jgi:hypothetical protein